MKAAKTMIRLHKLRMDELRKVLRDLEDQRDGVQHRLTALAIEMARELDLAEGMAQQLGYQNYYAAAIQRRERMNGQLTEIERKISAQRDLLQEAFEEMKRFELLDEQARVKAQAEFDRKEQIFADEVALTQHRRKNS